MTNNPDEAVPVEQCDRDAAADRLEARIVPDLEDNPVLKTAARIRAGQYDKHGWVQAFARHRRAAQSPPPVSEMRMPSREAMRQKIDADPDLETEACTPTTTQGDEAAGETAAFPPSCCTAWEDCNHDGVCHDPTGCGAVGPNAYESDHEGEDTP